MTKSTNFTLLFAIYKSPNCQNRNLRGSPVADPIKNFLRLRRIFPFFAGKLAYFVTYRNSKKKFIGSATVHQKQRPQRTTLVISN